MIVIYNIIRAEINVFPEINEGSLQLEDIEDSMQNIWDPIEMQRFKQGRRESKVKRLEDSRIYIQ